MITHQQRNVPVLKEHEDMELCDDDTERLARPVALVVDVGHELLVGDDGVLARHSRHVDLTSEHSRTYVTHTHTAPRQARATTRDLGYACLLLNSIRFDSLLENLSSKRGTTVGF